MQHREFGVETNHRWNTSKRKQTHSHHSRIQGATLIQTGKIGKFPIVMVGLEYWGGLIKWIKEVMHSLEHNVTVTDFDLFHLVDNAEDAVKVIDDFYEEFVLSPNF